MKKVPEDLWVKTHHTLIFFGRYHCTARAPKCEVCPLLTMCQEGQLRMRAKKVQPPQ
ncbi:Endonuclease III [Enterococcus sp. HSIEG1]|nr:Endonuclease III [Enterococcus sp. HSIEG1]